MKIKRVLAGSLAALATGATLTFGIFAAGLGDYVKTSGSTLTSPAIVIGAPAQPSSDFALDVVGAADIAAAVAGYATTVVPISGSASSVGVSGGADLSSNTRKLYMGSLINEAKTTLTAQDLPTVLKSGKVTVSGVDYKYDQYINLGARQIKFDKANAELTDPAVYLDVGTSEASPIYNTTVVFSKALNVSSSSVQGKKITLFGSDFTVGSQSLVYTGGTTNNKLELFGYGSSLLLEGGSGPQKINIGGVDHEVELSFVTTDAQAYVIIDGEGDSFLSGDSGVLGGVNLYMKNVWPITNTLGRAEISFGSSKLVLQHGSEVKYGESDTGIDNTLVEITGDNSGVSKIVVSIAASDSTKGYATVDKPFVDPVFGTFKVAFSGLVPDLASAARGTITVDNSGTTTATVKVTDYRSNEKTLTFAYTGSTWGPMLNETSTRKFHVVEGEPITKNDYILITPTQESEFSHLYQLTGLSNVGTSSASIQLTDVFSGDVTTVYLTDTVATYLYAGKDFYIDGQTFHVAAVSPTNSTVKFFWGAGSSQTSAGTKTTVFPLVKLKDGEYFSFTEDVTPIDTSIAASETHIYEVPGGDINITVSALSASYWINGVLNTTEVQNVTVGQLQYTIESAAAASGRTLSKIHLKDTYYSEGNNVNNVGVLVYEEQNNATVANAVVLSVSKDSSSYMIAAIPTFTGLKWSDTLGSDTSITQYVNDYGTFATYDSDSQGLAKVYYPDTQGIATVAIGPNPTFSAAAGTGTIESAVKITSPVAKLASEVSTSALSSDLILIGGPCANSLVAQLLGSDEQCATWAHTTGIIKEVSNAFSSGKKALIVAGTKATDTRALAAKVMQGTLSYSA
jgi:hypothetical protein